MWCVSERLYRVIIRSSLIPISTPAFCIHSYYNKLIPVLQSLYVYSIETHLAITYENSENSRTVGFSGIKIIRVKVSFIYIFILIYLYYRKVAYTIRVYVVLLTNCTTTVSERRKVQHATKEPPPTYFYAMLLLNAHPSRFEITG